MKRSYLLKVINLHLLLILCTGVAYCDIIGKILRLSTPYIVNFTPPSENIEGEGRIKETTVQTSDKFNDTRV